MCDRVGILRAGRLVEIDTHRRSAPAAPNRRRGRPIAAGTPRWTTSPGVSNVERLDGQRLRFSLSGPPAPALRALAAADVTALAMREPTLEEIFLDYYGEAAR